MTGAEHYREAEQAISASTWQRQEWADPGNSPGVQDGALRAANWEARRAQAHALLAIAGRIRPAAVAGALGLLVVASWHRAAAARDVRRLQREARYCP